MIIYRRQGYLIDMRTYFKKAKNVCVCVCLCFSSGYTLHINEADFYNKYLPFDNSD